MPRSSYRVLLDQRIRINNALKIIAISIALAMIYPLLAREINDGLAFLNAAIIGTLAGLLVAWHEDMRSFGHMRRMSFVKRFIISALMYTAGFMLIVMVVYGITRSFEHNMGFVDFVLSEYYRDFIVYGDFSVIVVYALFLGSALSFFFSMRRKIERHLLWNLITGYYIKPRQESRIIMAIDLNDSTAIAEGMDVEMYFDFVNEFFADITPVIMLTRGEIHRYVGDQVLVSWPLERGVKEFNCIRTFLIARQELKRQREKYFERFGRVPKFKAAIHCGDLVVGELGEVKCQIVMHGNAMYMTEQIEKMCRRSGNDLLVSDSIKEMVRLPDLYKYKKIGKIENINEQSETTVFTVVETV